MVRVLVQPVRVAVEAVRVGNPQRHVERLK